MKTALTLTTALALALAGGASAQSLDSTSASQSQSYSGIQTEGDTINSSSAIAPSINATAPCVVPMSMGFGVAGFGLAGGTGKMDGDCVTRTEADILVSISTMPATQKVVAVTHFCTFDATMRQTMVALGWCAVRQ
jgi:hypothetical protein|tara:strand:+ start:1326 stop:1733 length:408 start_codon:yes stop_codon:yes gene_type:complete